MTWNPWNSKIRTTSGPKLCGFERVDCICFVLVKWFISGEKTKKTKLLFFSKKKKKKSFFIRGTFSQTAVKCTNSFYFYEFLKYIWIYGINYRQYNYKLQSDFYFENSSILWIFLRNKNILRISHSLFNELSYQNLKLFYQILQNVSVAFIHFMTLTNYKWIFQKPQPPEIVNHTHNALHFTMQSSP